MDYRTIQALFGKLKYKVSIEIKKCHETTTVKEKGRLVKHSGQLYIR